MEYYGIPVAGDKSYVKFDFYLTIVAGGTGGINKDKTK
jgi:hypothetical protein